MNNLKELEKKYEELGEEIKKLKEDEKKKKDDVCADYIFLLSTEDYEKYKNAIPYIKNWWWLRSPGYFCDTVALVTDRGSVDLHGTYSMVADIAIRPALKISNLESFSGRYIDDKVIYCGITWVKIDEDLYISEMPIAYRGFNSGRDNNYKTSEIRQFLLNWYEERKDY